LIVNTNNQIIAHFTTINKFLCSSGEKTILTLRRVDLGKTLEVQAEVNQDFAKRNLKTMQFDDDILMTSFNGVMITS